MSNPTTIPLTRFLGAIQHKLERAESLLQSLYENEGSESFDQALGAADLLIHECVVVLRSATAKLATQPPAGEVRHD